MEFTYTDSLKNEVPKGIRLEVYKRAKNLIENWEDGVFELNRPELFLLLPCILYKCDKYLDRGTCETHWNYVNTTRGFIELTEDDIKRIIGSYNPTKVRLELLTQWIEQLEK